MSAPVPVLMIRHGETQWNTDGRIQGSSDVPLSDVGRADVARWRLPERFSHFRWMASDLARARDTARLMGAPEGSLALDARLREMHWGEWEGLTLADLAHRMDEIRARRAREGLDFKAPDGESNRELQFRLGAWLADVAVAGHPTVAVAHKGVLRAMVSLATGWDMRGPLAKDLDWQAAHLFHTGADGRLEIVELDISLIVP
jgi:probable phosphoglycerate mutase